MNSEAYTSGNARAVALLAPSERLSPVRSADLVVATNGYLAAAELLSAPARCLVVNLSRIVGPHVGLLTLARRLGVSVVAYGTISAALPAAALQGVRLVAAEQVPAAVDELLGSPGVSAPVEPAAPSAMSFAPAMPTSVGKAPEVAAQPDPAQTTPAAPPAAARTRSTDRFDAPAAPPATPQPPSAPEAAVQAPAKAVLRPARPAEMLTREEIDALLEESI